MEGRSHLGVEFFQHFLLCPVEVHVVLDRFEVGSCHAARVAQEVRDVEDIVGLEEVVRFGCAGAIGAFSHDLDAVVHLLDGIAVDVAFDGGRDEHITFLLNPLFAIFHDIPGILGFFLINRAVLVNDGQQEARIDAVFVAVGVGGLVVAIPAGNAGDFSAQHFHKADGRILADVAEAFERRH